MRPGGSTASPPSRTPSVGLPPVELVLGVDFGTSCTKVVIGDPGFKRQAFAVPFRRPESDLACWLKPTVLGNEANLKMRLMDRPDDRNVRELVAAYLAEVIRDARRWFDANASAEYTGREQHWILNLGFPGTRTEASPLAAAYQAVGEVALRSVAHSGQAPRRIQLYPEIAAQLAGYVTSPHAQKGNLVLIDVGAGTLDVSTMINHGDNDGAVLSFFVCDVKPLGILRFYQTRVSALESVRPGCVKIPPEHFQKTAAPVPENLDDIVGSRSADLNSRDQAVRKEFFGEVVRVAVSCMARFSKVQRQAHRSRAFVPWPHQLPVFLTGGGSRADSYRRCLTGTEIEGKLLPITRWVSDPARRRSLNQGLRVEKLPVPNNLKSFPLKLAEDFDRISVAYGLALGNENLMRITK
jgi:hypothetical protein